MSVARCVLCVRLKPSLDRVLRPQKRSKLLFFNRSAVGYEKTVGGGWFLLDGSEWAFLCSDMHSDNNYNRCWWTSGVCLPPSFYTIATTTPIAWLGDSLTGDLWQKNIRENDGAVQNRHEKTCNVYAQL